MDLLKGYNLLAQAQKTTSGLSGVEVGIIVLICVMAITFAGILIYQKIKKNKNKDK